jgi:putative membrane protein insertion efficiency factor
MKVLAGAAIGLVMLYRYGFAWLKPKTCRFAPTCSEYAITALKRHGVVKGGGLALRRIVRCHPWGGSGFDPVP